MARSDHVDGSVTLAKHILMNYGKGSNLVFSPILIQVILGLIAAGSSGQTLDQLLSFLKAKNIDELNSLYSSIIDRVFANDSSPGGPCLSLANGVWLEESLTLKPSFIEVVETVYKAACHQVDFQNKAEELRNVVNSWVEKETRGLIKEILPAGSVNSYTRLVFANAVYFKGAWSCEFNASKTKHFDFHLLNVDTIRVPFMTRSEKRYISEFDDFKVLKLPYEQGGNQSSDECSFSMYIYLPDANDGLPALIEKIGSESGFLDRYIPYKEVDGGKFWIPKFKFESEIEASEALKSLGMVLPFDPNAGSTEMVYDPSWPPGPLHVSEIFHKSFIEVDEKGTEAAAAAAAAAAVFCYYMAPLKEVSIDFVADHPFLFVIRENNTGIVQFMGQVLNPSST